jgi:addiction module HigA family antidote
VIKSFKDKVAEAVFNDETRKGFPADLFKVTRRKLMLLDAAEVLDDVKAPPGNRLEALKGNRAGQHSIRINDQFRVALSGPSKVRRTLKLSITIDRPAREKLRMVKKLPPMHPGEVLREEFLAPLALSAGKLARICGVPRTRMERIANEETGITADTALRLSRALGTTAQMWLNLQNNYDVRVAKREIGKELARIGRIEPNKAA